MVNKKSNKVASIKYIHGSWKFNKNNLFIGP